MTVYWAKVTQPDDPEACWFASVDGEDYLPVQRKPRVDDESDVAALFEPQKESDGRTSHPIVWVRRGIRLEAGVDGSAEFGQA